MFKLQEYEDVDPAVGKAAGFNGLADHLFPFQMTDAK